MIYQWVIIGNFFVLPILGILGTSAHFRHFSLAFSFPIFGGAKMAKS
jgi:hypothetical protein